MERLSNDKSCVVGNGRTQYLKLQVMLTNLSITITTNSQNILQTLIVFPTVDQLEIRPTPILSYELHSHIGRHGKELQQRLDMSHDIPAHLHVDLRHLQQLDDGKPLHATNYR